ncbi:hypothetical protein evm_013897 [Chilo suppressalis]|nr:hypothetical protein evm_013897 [Chilo suppressalis]
MDPSKSLFALTFILVIVVSHSFEVPTSQEINHELLANNQNEKSVKPSKNEEFNESYYTVDNLPKKYKVLLSKSKSNDFHNWFDNKNPRNKVVKIIYRKRTKGSLNRSNNKDSKNMFDWLHSNNYVNDIESGHSFYSTGNHKSSSRHHKKYENSVIKSKVHKPRRLHNNHGSNTIIRNVKYVTNVHRHDRDGVPDSSDVIFEEHHLPKLKNLKIDWANYDVKRVSHNQPKVLKSIKIVNNDYMDGVSKNHKEFDLNNITSEDMEDVDSEEEHKENSTEVIPPENVTNKENSHEYMSPEDVHDEGFNSQTISHKKVPSLYVVNEDVTDENFVNEDATDNENSVNEDATDNENSVNEDGTSNTDVPLRNGIPNNIIVTTEPKDMPNEDITTEDVTSENVTSENVTSENVTSEDVTSKNVTSENDNFREVPDHDVTSEDISVENDFNKPPFESVNNAVSKEDTSNITDLDVSPEHVSSEKKATDIVSKELITDDNISGDVWSEDGVNNKITSEDGRDGNPFNNVIGNDNNEDIVSDISPQASNNVDDSSEVGRSSAFKVKPTKTLMMNKDIFSDMPFENVINVLQTKPKSKYLKQGSEFEKSVKNYWVTSVNNVNHKPRKVSSPGSEVPFNYNPSELVIFQKMLTEICNKAKKLLGSKPTVAVINRLKLILKELNVLNQFLDKHTYIRIDDKSLPIKIKEFIKDKTRGKDDFYSDRDESSDYNDTEFPVLVPIIHKLNTRLIPDDNKQENPIGESYSAMINQLLRDLKQLKPQYYDPTIQPQFEELVKYLQNFLQNSRKNLNPKELPYMKTYLIPIVRALRNQLEKGPKSPKLTLKWNISLLLSFLHERMDNDSPDTHYDWNGKEYQNPGNETFGKNLYDVLNSRERGSADDPVFFLVQWLSKNDDNDNMKWDIDESTVRKVLTLFQQNGITIENIRKLILYLYHKNSNGNNKNDCTTKTYNNILKKSLKFLNFVSLLTTKEK